MLEELCTQLLEEVSMLNVVEAKRPQRKKPIKVPRPYDEDAAAKAAKVAGGRPRRSKDDAEATRPTRSGAERGPQTVTGFKGMLALAVEQMGYAPPAGTGGPGHV